MTSTNIYYVYQYINPITGIPFYVGYGHQGRHLSHLNEAIRHPAPTQGDHKLNIIRKLIRLNAPPTITIIKNLLSKEEARALEIELIAKIGRLHIGTGPLTNLTPGGDGGDTTSQHPNKKEITEKKSKKAKGMVSVRLSTGEIKRVSIAEQHLYTPMNEGSKRTRITRNKQSKSAIEACKTRHVPYVTRVEDKKVMSVIAFQRWLNKTITKKYPKIICSRISDRKVIAVNHLNRTPTPRISRLSDRKEMDIVNFKKYLASK